MDARVLIVNNYDSFTYKLVQFMGEVGAANDVFRLSAHPIPDRIERRQFRTLRIDLMHCHVLLSQIRLLSARIIARRRVRVFSKSEPQPGRRMRAKTLKRHVFLDTGRGRPWR